MKRERTQVVHVRTSEGVAFAFRIASPVLRAGAVIIDIATVAAAMSVIGTIVGALRLVSRDAAAMALTLSYFIIAQSYSIFAEWHWRGQTLGKRILRLRVVDASGLRLSFPQVMVRNLLRVIDQMPLFYLVGGIAALLSSRGQRLGDLVANTLVVWEPADTPPDINLFRTEKYNSLRSHAPTVARLRQTVSTAKAQAALSALARRDQLDAEARIKLFAELAEHFRTLARPPSEVTEGIADEHFVRNVVDVLYLNR